MTEILDIVDKDDNKIGRATRSHVHSSKLWHRGIHIILFDSQGRILIQKRSPTKDKFPGRFDMSLSEHVSSGEYYDEVARRGLFEELGVKLNEIKRLIKFRLDYGDTDNMMGILYTAKYEREFFIDEREIEKLEFETPETLKKLILEQPTRFTRWARELFKWYFGMPSSIEVLEHF